MSSRTCPDWPKLMEYAPDLQFKHYTVAEARLPADALVHVEGVSLSEVALCCDLERHVFYAEHTDPAVAAWQLPRRNQGHGVPADAVCGVRAADARDG